LAEITDTSCSGDFPPNKIATFIILFVCIFVCLKVLFNGTNVGNFVERKQNPNFSWGILVERKRNPNLR
jgi:hypothetical protein